MNGSSAFARTMGSLRTAFTAAVEHARLQRANGIRNPFCPPHPASNGQLPPKFNPSKLDITPRILFQRGGRGKVVHFIGDEAGFSAAKQRCMPARTEPCPVNLRGSAQESLLKTWMNARLKYNHKACPAHGATSTMPNVGGNGGGSFRLDFEQARLRSWSSHEQKRQYRRCSNAFSLKRHWGSSAYSTFHAHRRTVKGTGRRSRASTHCKQAFKRAIRGLTEHVRYDRMAHLSNASHRGPALTADGLDHTQALNATSRHQQQQHQHQQAAHSQAHLRRPPPWSHPSGKLHPPPPLLGSSSGLRLCCCCPHPPPPLASHQTSPSSVRAFSSSASTHGVAHLGHAAFKLGQLLKSADALGYINILFRIGVSVVPLASWKRAVYLRRARVAAALAASAGSGAGAGAKIGATAASAAIPSGIKDMLIKLFCRGAIALPFVLLAAVLLAALEKTPITGRWRLVLLNEQEERDIVAKVLKVGEPASSTVVPAAPAATAAVPADRDWLIIMRAVLGEQEAPEGTLLGGRVLPSSDWRVSFVSRTLAKLEAGLPALSSSSSSSTTSSSSLPKSTSERIPPALSHPLGKHARSSHLLFPAAKKSGSTAQQGNAVLVIDRPEANAFSFGFFGATDAHQPGVVIVFTGAIDEIMRSTALACNSPGSNNNPGLHPAKPILLGEEEEAMQALFAQRREDPSWLKAFMDTFTTSASSTASERSGRQQQQQQQQRQAALPSPNKAQEEALAVLLAHELAHLVLSHTIESYASTNLLYPQLEKLGWDREFCPSYATRIAAIKLTKGCAASRLLTLMIS